MRRYIYALLLAASSVAAGKYVLVEEPLTWRDAQLYCRTHFTELASFSSSRDMEEIHKAQEVTSHYYFWVGLYRGETGEESWRWSGGGNASFLPWARGQPYSGGHQGELCLKCVGDSYGLLGTQSRHRFFLCLNLVVVVTERRTWEEALEYCRERHHDLASLASETDRLVASRELREAQAGERVWVGLRHLGARWMWMQGEPLGNKASLWTGLQGAPCSTCGSLSHSGELQALHCNTQLHFLCY